MGRSAFLYLTVWMWTLNWSNEFWVRGFDQWMPLSDRARGENKVTNGGGVFRELIVVGVAMFLSGSTFHDGEGNLLTHLKRVICCQHGWLEEPPEPVWESSFSLFTCWHPGSLERKVPYSPFFPQRNWKLQIPAFSVLKQTFTLTQFKRNCKLPAFLLGYLLCISTDKASRQPQWQGFPSTPTGGRENSLRFFYTYFTKTLSSANKARKQSSMKQEKEKSFIPKHWINLQETGICFSFLKAL